MSVRSRDARVRPGSGATWTTPALPKGVSAAAGGITSAMTSYTVTKLGTKANSKWAAPAVDGNCNVKLKTYLVLAAWCRR